MGFMVIGQPATVKVLFALALTASAAFTVGCAARATSTPTVAPPPPRAVQVDHRPDHVWIAGRWTWRNQQWVWTPGHWARKRHGYYYTAGRWIARDGRYVYVEGAWRRDARAQRQQQQAQSAPRNSIP